MTDLGTISYGVPLSSLANLENVSELSNKQSAKPNSFAQYRTKEHDKLLGQYGAEYKVLLLFPWVLTRDFSLRHIGNRQPCATRGSEWSTG